MTRYKCDNCGQFTDENPCTYCQSTRVREVSPSDADEPSYVPPPPPAAPYYVEDEPEEEPPPQSFAPPPSRSTPPAPAPASAEKKVIANLDQFESLLNQGFEAIVICGQSQSGKSEIATGFTRANAVFRGRTQVSTTFGSSGVLYAAGGTAPDSVWYEIANTRRKLVFLDPSGEFFKNLSPTHRQKLRIDITEEYFDFVRAAVRKLAGIVLVADLTKTLDDFAQAPWRAQENDLDFTLAALRWLRFDKSARMEGTSISTNIAARASQLPRLDVPVLTLFSKADLLSQHSNAEPVIDFARRRLPHLHASLITHARRFRFEFVHTMHGLDRHARREERPCGVLLSMEWLLSDPFRWIPTLPTRWLGGGK